MKNVLKEISIFVLIIAAIILVLCVLLYEDIPTSKVVPTTIAYETPENLKAEIEDELTEDIQEVIITYQIDKSDLNVYQEISSYVPGRQHPFKKYSEEEGTGARGTTGGNASTGGNSSTGNSEVSDEEFFNSNKTK